MDTSAQVFFNALGILVLTIFFVGLIGEVVVAWVKLEQVNPQKSKEQWQLEVELAWKCYQANYFWRFPWRWAKKRSLQAARFLRSFSQGEWPIVIVRWSPDAPSKRCYRLCNRFDPSA